MIDDKVFCVHGGLSPSVPEVSFIDVMEREQEVPAEGALCDLLWSDPDEGAAGMGQDGKARSGRGERLGR